MSSRINLRDVSRPGSEPLIHIENEELMALPAPLDSPEKDRPWAALSEQCQSRYECGLDDTCAVNIPQPKSREEEEAAGRKVSPGLEKLFERRTTGPSSQPLLLTMEHCAKCQTCADACHIFEASGRNELYRPTFRSEIVRRLYFKYVKARRTCSPHGSTATSN